MKFPILFITYGTTVVLTSLALLQIKLFLLGYNAVEILCEGKAMSYKPGTFEYIEAKIRADAKGTEFGLDFEKGIKDSTLISLGFTPEDVGDFKVPKTEHTEEKKKFIDEKTQVGLGAITLGVGALGLFYLLSKHKNR